jgi:hypothetical protein
MSAESAEAVEFLHYWIGSGHVKDIGTKIVMEEIELDGFVGGG